MNSPQLKKYHFIGIGGIGMSALARILLDQRLSVSGSDLSVSDNTQELIQKGANVHLGHSEEHIVSETTVVFSSQIQSHNPEYQAALRLKCPMLHRSELLAQLMQNTRPLAVAGTHGKTTTSSMLTTVLMHAGLDPTFAVGGMVGGLNGKLGAGNYFVAEADESDGSFLNYHPYGAIITNVEAEHLDHYKSEDALRNAFRTFFLQVKEPNALFYCGDDATLTSLSGGRGLSYGFGAGNDLVISSYSQHGWSIQFDLHFEEKHYAAVQVPQTGQHNALNAAAVFGLALRLGISEEKIRGGLQAFPGVGRRCEKRGEAHGILCIDDYGHHPTEVSKTIKAVKSAVQERRLVVVFQPHRYTRTRDLMDEFSRAFEMADVLYVTDIYSAFETPIPGIDAQALVGKIRAISNVPCNYLPKHEMCEQLCAALQPHDVVLTLGAGDITRLPTDLLKNLRPKKIRLGLIFGGLSCEHEISVRSSRFVSESLNSDLYDVRYFGIDKQGRWIVGEEALDLLKTQPVIASPAARSVLDPVITQQLADCDLFFPVLHGTNGEDGTIQGFFEMLGKPYVGPDYRSAAICMDKVLTKRLAKLGGVNTPRDLTFGYLRWLSEKEELIKTIAAELPMPVYVKPVHLGSSVGISRVTHVDQLAPAIEAAFRFDTQVMVEEGKVGCRELEFAVVGNTHSFSVTAPNPGEKLAEGDFVDYEKKYGTNTVRTTLETGLSPELLEKGKKCARTAYESVGCTGMTRVDFLLDTAGEFWLFEMNSIPGMQKLSLFPKIWNRDGVAPDKLLDKLIMLALERQRTQKRHIRCLQ